MQTNSAAQTNSDEQEQNKSSVLNASESRDKTMKPVEDEVMHRDAGILASTTDGGASTRACASDQTMASSSTALAIPTMSSSSTALAVPGTMSEKRGSADLAADGAPVGKRTRTVMHTTITPVTKLVTKKGKSVTVECNEERNYA